MKHCVYVIRVQICYFCLFIWIHIRINHSLWHITILSTFLSINYHENCVLISFYELSPSLFINAKPSLTDANNFNLFNGWPCLSIKYLYWCSKWSKYRGAACFWNMNKLKLTSRVKMLVRPSHTIWPPIFPFIIWPKST